MIHVFARFEDARAAFINSTVKGRRIFVRQEIQAADGIHRFIAPTSIEGVCGLTATTATYAFDVREEVRRELDLRITTTKKGN